MTLNSQELRSLLLELANQLEHDRRRLMDDRNWIVPLADRARAAAAELGEQSERAMILSRRLKELSTAAADGRMAEFLMRIPAEPDRDADLVLSESSDMLARFGGGEAP